MSWVLQSYGPWADISVDIGSSGTSSLRVESSNFTTSTVKTSTAGVGMLEWTSGRFRAEVFNTFLFL